MVVILTDLEINEKIMYFVCVCGGVEPNLIQFMWKNLENNPLIARY